MKNKNNNYMDETLGFEDSELEDVQNRFCSDEFYDDECDEDYDECDECNEIDECEDEDDFEKYFSSLESEDDYLNENTDGYYTQCKKVLDDSNDDFCEDDNLFEEDFNDYYNSCEEDKKEHHRKHHKCPDKCRDKDYEKGYKAGYDKGYSEGDLAGYGRAKAEVLDYVKKHRKKCCS